MIFSRGNVLPGKGSRWVSIFVIGIVFFSGIFSSSPRSAEAKPLLAAIPSVTLDVPSQVMIGEGFSFDVIFDNNGSPPATSTGYGPFIDVVFPNNGADGAAGTDTPDGISFNAALGATYGGIQLTCETRTFDSSGNAEHPFYKDTSGAYHVIQGIPGDTLVSCLLPFGSVVPEQPPARVTFNALISNLADVGTSMPIRARGGFMFGADPLDNWCCDVIAPNPNTNDSANWTGPNQADVTPTILTLSKTYNGPEDETATGPNFPRQFTITVDIADGETITNLELSDIFPDNVQYVSIDSISGNGTGTITSISTPSTATPGGTLTRLFDQVVGGTSANDASITINFYIPRDNSGSTRVIDPNSGNDVQSPNNASALGDWTPDDIRDPSGTDNVSAGVPGPEYTLNDKSIAIQKGHTNLTGGGNSPDDVIEYTYSVQISDFFAFRNLVTTDVISDGQHLDPSFTPQLSVEGNNGYALPATDLTAANFDVNCNYSGTQGSECTASDPAADTGETTLVIRISDELISQGRANGNLLGGCVPWGGGTADCSIHDDDATTVTITYRTIILEDFVNTYPSGDTSVDQGDEFSNDVVINGDILDNPTLLTAVGSENDDSSEGFAIGRDILEKFIFAIDGDTGYASPIHVKPRDEITFQLIYNLTTSDVENLAITDYLPLPVLNVDDFDADGTGGDTWGWPTGLDDKCTSLTGGEDISINPGIFIPAPGLACINSGDTFTDYSGIVPTLTSSVPANSLNFEYGDYDNPADLATRIDILFTISVNNEPYADGLYFTNQSEVYEGSTNSGDQSTDTIINFILDEPYLVLDKGAIASSNANAIFDPSPLGPGIPISPPGTAGVRWTGVIGSDDLAATPMSSAISNVDAGDLVSFALVIENQGNSGNGAFDIQVSDIIPPGFSIPSGGINLSVYRGDRNPPTGYIGDLFGAGLEITDSGPSSGACQTYHPSNGSNIILIIYDLQVDSDIDPEAELENLGTVFNYANEEGGPDFTGSDADLTASTTTTIAVPGVVKTLLDTGIDETNNDDTEAVIGETAQYQAVLTIPEGEMQLSNFIDDLEQGLRFVSLDSLSVSNTTDVTSSSDTTGNFSNIADFTPTESGTGTVGDPQTITIDFGTLINSNQDNNTPETITLTYTVLVLNVSSSQQSDILSNAAYLAWDEDGDAGTSDDAHQTAPESADLIVVEPQINVTKSVEVGSDGDNNGDAGDLVEYEIIITADANRPTAYDAVLSDFLSSDIDFSAAGYGIISVSDPVGGLGIADFEISPARELRLVSPPIDMVPGRQITINLNGELRDTVHTGQNIINNAVMTWTDLVGTNASSGLEDGERTGQDGAGGLNDYENTGTAVIDVTEPSPQKTVVLTSEIHTGTGGDGRPRVAIGEILRYRIEIRLAEGTSNDVILWDELPDGLMFLNDNTAKVVFVSTSGVDIDSQDTFAVDVLGIDDVTAFASGDETSVGGITPVYSLPDTNISSSLSSNNDTYTSGGDVYFKLGDIVNSDVDDNFELAVVEFNALVTNIASSVSGVSLGNRFNVMVDSDGDEDTEVGEIIETSSYHYVTIAEPVVEVTKSNNPVPHTGDAGDDHVYDITIRNISSGDNGAAAFDLVISDTVDANLNLLSVSVAGVGGSCGSTTQTSPPPSVITGFGGSFSVSLSCLNPGDSIVVTVNTRVHDNVLIDYTIPNTALLTGTSLPDTGTPYDRPGTPTDNYTGSETFSVPGSTPGNTIGERTGTGVSPNLYRDDSSVDLILDQPTPTKSIVSTSETHTAEGTPRDLTIGEEVRYRLTVNLPEGISTNMSLVDVLPLGFTYLGDARISFTATDIVVDGDLSAAHDNSVPPIFAMPGARIAVAGQQVTFTLGTIDNNDINDSNQELVVIDFDVLVNNDANNNNTDLDNNDFDVLLDGTVVNTSNQVQTRIVEPLLNIAKVSQETEPNYGETFTYDLTVSYLGASLAQGFDITISDVIPVGLTYVPGSAGPASWSPSYDGPTRTLSWTCSSPVCSFLLGGTVGLFYDVDMAAAPGPPDPDDDLTNYARLEWTSLDGPNSNERSGNNNGGTEPYNDYGLDVSEDVTLSNIDLRIEKDDRGAVFSAGDTLIYDLSYYNDGNITATGVVITETVPANTTFDLAGSSGTWSCADNSPAGTTCTQLPGSVAPSAGVPTTVQFAVTIDNPLPAGVTTVTNDVSIADDGANGPEPTPGNNSDSIVTPSIAANPDLTITKDDGLDIVAPGSRMVYSLVYENVGTQHATGVVITETVSTGVTFDLGNSSAGWIVQATGLPAVDGETAGTVLEFDIGNVNVGDAPVTVNFAVLVDNPLAPGITEISNTASIADDGANGPDLTPGDNSDDDDDGIAFHDKNLVSLLHGVTTSPDVAIGEILTYEVTLTIPPGSMTNTHLIDTLDRGLAFVSCQSITPNSITTSAAGGYANICSSPAVSTYPAGSPNAEDDGRQVDFDFDTLTNLDAVPVDLVISYRVVVLDSLANQSGSTPLLINDAEWVWDSGDLTDQADGVNILEPDMALSKSASPTVLYPGQLTTFTLTIEHTAGSQTSAFDVEVEDIIPSDLIFQSATHVSGQVPTSIITTGDPTILIQWNEFLNNGENSVIDIVVMLDPAYRQQRNNQYITNDASLAWTSLANDYSSPQSVHNTLSTERFYDPLSNVNIYGLGDDARIRIPALPDTGFAPGKVTDLPLQKEGQEYSDLDGLLIEISKLGISVPIVSVPISDNGWDLTWLWNQAGWLEGSAYPSWYGNTVITGHAYLPSGYPGPFVDLGKLTWDDEITLYAHGLKYTYQVRFVDLVAADDYSILQHKDQDWLTLFTCKDYSDEIGGYIWRQAVQAVLIDVGEIE